MVWLRGHRRTRKDGGMQSWHLRSDVILQKGILPTVHVECFPACTFSVDRRVE